MTQLPETDNVDDIEGASPEENAVIANLRKEAKEGKAAKAELAVLQRERAFDKAGIPETGAGKWFRQGYQGELDPDAIKAVAAEDGLIDVIDTDTSPEVAAAATAADRIADAASDGGSPQVTVDTLIANASTIDEIEAVMQSAGLGVQPS